MSIAKAKIYEVTVIVMVLIWLQSGTTKHSFLV